MFESVLKRWDNFAKKEREGVNKSSTLREYISIQSWMWTIIFTVFLFQILHLARDICITYQPHQLKFTFSWGKTCMRRIFLFMLRLLGLIFYCNSSLNMVLCWRITFCGNWIKGSMYVILYEITLLPLFQEYLSNAYSVLCMHMLQCRDIMMKAILSLP